MRHAIVRVVATGALVVALTVHAGGQADAIPPRVQQILTRLDGRWLFEMQAADGLGTARRGVRVFRAIPQRPGVVEWSETFDQRPGLQIHGYFGYATNRSEFFEIGQLAEQWPELHAGVLDPERPVITFAPVAAVGERGVLTFEHTDRFVYRREAWSASAWVERWRVVFSRATAGVR